MTPTPACPWCAGDGEAGERNPDLLCRPHEAEYDGLSVAELDRRDREEGAEYAEWVLGH
jgi:hypothetical protein